MARARSTAAVAGTAPTDVVDPSAAGPVVEPDALGAPASPVELFGVLADVLLRRAAVDEAAERGGDDGDPVPLVDRLPTFVAGDDDPVPGRSRLDELAAEVRAAFHAALDEPSRFASICANARLDADAAEALAVLAAVDLEPARQRVVGWLHDDTNQRRVSAALLVRVLGTGGALALAPRSALRRAALVQVHDGPTWATTTFGLAPVVAWALVGDDRPDPELPWGATGATAADGAGHPLVLVSGADRASRAARAVALAAGDRFLVAPAPADERGWDALVREATLSGTGIVLELDAPPAPVVAERVEQADHLVWALSSPDELPVEALPRRPWVEERVVDGAPTAAEWQAVTGAEPPAGHRLHREHLRLVAAALAGGAHDPASAVRRLASGHLGPLATHTRARRGWTDIVLPPPQMTQLRHLAARYRHRDIVHGEWGVAAVPSAGLVAMFTGPSGTGKTLAAEVVAHDLGLDLYRVDLSAVVSKYVGETEQHLARLFDAAASAGLVLFFDEADALFGKRSEVTDAHDRYANIETSYLLQRLEVYDGLVVLATNLANNLDQAFLRRIHLAVEFPVPEEPERLAIWELALPAGVPRGDDLDLGFLARQFRLTGGSIRNTGLTAAFLAAEAGTAVTMTAAIIALRMELEKAGRLVTEVEFGDWLAVARGEG